MKYIEINNRRYLGNKYKLLPFITETIKNECGEIESFADIFAGTGSVASAYTDKKVITNDLLYSNYICNFALYCYTFCIHILYPLYTYKRISIHTLLFMYTDML